MVNKAARQLCGVLGLKPACVRFIRRCLLPPRLGIAAVDNDLPQSLEAGFGGRLLGSGGRRFPHLVFVGCEPLRLWSELR